MSDIFFKLFRKDIRVCITDSGRGFPDGAALSQEPLGVVETVFEHKTERGPAGFLLKKLAEGFVGEPQRGRHGREGKAARETGIKEKLLCAVDQCGIVPGKFFFSFAVQLD